MDKVESIYHYLQKQIHKDGRGCIPENWPRNKESISLPSIVSLIFHP